MPRSTPLGARWRAGRAGFALGTVPPYDGAMDAKSLPLYLTPLVRQWKCRQRGMCCKVHSIPITETERRRIARHLAADHDPRAELVQEGALHVVDGWQQLPRQGGACVFLEQNLCSLHKRFGAQSIPGACRKFPHLLLLTDDRLVASLSFQCPTALELLAHAPGFEVVVEPEGEPPTDSVSWLAEPDKDYFDLAGRRVTAQEFWRLHWQLLERLDARTERDPWERLVAFAAMETGQSAPPRVALPPEVWSAPWWNMAVSRELEQATGERAYDLGWWWVPMPPQEYTFDRPADLDEAAFVTRYVLHRMFAPVWYLHHRDLRFGIAMLFALLVRIRVERARGHDVTVAVRHTDRFFVHVPNPEELFGTREQPVDPALPWGCSWRVLAALAGATG